MKSTEETNIAFVRAFASRWGDSYKELRQAFLDVFADDCLFQQTRVPDLVGGPMTVAFLDHFRESGGWETVGVEERSIVAQGNVVVYERIDFVKDAVGSILLTFPAVGIIKVANGKIVSWRDYFDSADMKPSVQNKIVQFNYQK